jgi:hypothetical protein
VDWASEVEQRLKTALILSAIWIALVWYLFPALESRYFGHSSWIRFDPKKSNDYNCIYVEGHSARTFSPIWLTHKIPLKFLRIRYTPNNNQDDYGIMFVDPQAFTFEAHDRFASEPSHLAARLDSPSPILNWIRSQPHSLGLPSHTNDAEEIYEAIRLLASRDLMHFSLPTDFKTNSLSIGYSSLAKDDGPTISNNLPLVLFWLPLIPGMMGKPPKKSH